MRAALVNDTSGEKHVGCNAVIAAIKGVAAMHGIEIAYTLTRGEVSNYGFKCKGSVDLVIVNGEGSLHHNSPNSKFLWDTLQSAKNDSCPCVLINTVWDGMELDDRQTELLNTLKLISCRESKSADQMNEARYGWDWVVPDMIFAHQPRDISEAPQKEGLVYCPGSGVLARQISQHEPQLLIQRHDGAPSFEDFCSELTNYDGVVTDRFHTCCIAMMCGLPVYALKANCHKVDGLAEDSGAFHVYDTVEMAENAPGDFDLDAAYSYKGSARDEIHELFYAIKECV